MELLPHTTLQTGKCFFHFSLHSRNVHLPKHHREYIPFDQLNKLKSVSYSDPKLSTLFSIADKRMNAYVI